MSFEGGSISGRSDAFARWGTLGPSPSTPLNSSADEAYPHAAPSHPSPPGAHAARATSSSTAVGVGRGTAAARAAAKSVSLVAPPGAGNGSVAPPATPPEKAQQSLRVTADRRANAKPLSCTATTATSSSGYDAHLLAESSPFFSGNGHGDARAVLSSSRHSPFSSGGSDADADALLARLAGKAKQAAAVALSASRAGNTTPLPTMSLDDGLENRQAHTGPAVMEVDPGVVGASDAGGGLGAVVTQGSAGAAAGKGESAGARLAQLCKEDKAKVARLMHDLAKLRAEKDVQKARFERLRAQNEAIVKEVASLRVKFGQSMQLLRKYQNIVKEGEIAGGRAAGVDSSDGFSGVTSAGSGPAAAAAAEEIRSLREALQAAERRSEKAETEAASERADREKMTEELRNMEADTAKLRRQLKLHHAATDYKGVSVGEGTVKNPPLVVKASAWTGPSDSVRLGKSLPEGCSDGNVDAGGGAGRSHHEGMAAQEVIGAAQTIPPADGGGIGDGGVPEVVSAAAVTKLQEQVEMLKQQLAMVGVRQLALTGLPLGSPALWERARKSEPSEAFYSSRGGVAQASMPPLPDSVDYRYRRHRQETDASAPERSLDQAVDGGRAEDDGGRAASGFIGVRREEEVSAVSVLPEEGADGLEQQQVQKKNRQWRSHAAEGVVDVGWGGGGEAARKEGMDGSWSREERRKGAGGVGVRDDVEVGGDVRVRVHDRSSSGSRRASSSDGEQAVQGSRVRSADGLLVVGGDGEDAREVGDSDGGEARRPGPESLTERSARGGQRADGQIRHISKVSAPSRALAKGAQPEREDRSLSQGRLTCGAGSGAVRRPRTWFEAASDRLSCGGDVGELERTRLSGAVAAAGADDEVGASSDEERDRSHRSANVRWRRRGLTSNNLIEEEEMGSGRRGDGGSAPEKLRVSWGSVSVHSGDTETDRGRLGSAAVRSGRGRDSAGALAAWSSGEQRGNAAASTRASTAFSRDPAVWSPSEPSRRRQDGARRPWSPEDRPAAPARIEGAVVSRRSACRLPSEKGRVSDREREEYSTGWGAAASASRRERVPPARTRVKPDLGTATAGASRRATGIGGSQGDGKSDERTMRCRVGEELGASEKGGFFNGDLLGLIDDIEEEDDFHGRRSEPGNGARPPPRRAPQMRPSTVSYPATRTARKSGDHRRDCQYRGGILERPGTVMGYSKR